MNLKNLVLFSFLLLGANMFAEESALLQGSEIHSSVTEEKGYGLLEGALQVRTLGSLQLAQLELPEIDLLGETEKGKGVKNSKKEKKEELIPRTKKPVKLQIAATEEKNAIGFSFQLINPAEMSVMVEFSDGSKKNFKMKPGSASYARDIPEKEFFKKKAEGTVLDGPAEFHNHTLVFHGALNLTYFMRPNFKRYKSKQVDQLLSKWDAELPDALTKLIRMEFLPDDKGCQIWLDGRYAGHLDGGSLKSVTINGGSGPEITKAEPFKYIPSKYLNLDTRYSARAGAMENGEMSLKPGMQEINGIPIIVAEPKNGIDIGQAKRMRSIELLECNEHLSRTAFDGMPESIHYSVPQAQYRRVYVLCAAEPSNEQFDAIQETAEEPEDKEAPPTAEGEMDKAAEREKKASDKDKPAEKKDAENTPSKAKTAEKPNPRVQKSQVLTARITRWGVAGRGDAIADTTIKFPLNDKEVPDKRLAKVGSITYQDGGKKITVPLYLVEFELETGDILDLVTGDWGKKDPNAPLRSIGPYLDFEFWGPMGGLNNFSDSRKIAGGPPSAVHVFGMTLEKSPIDFELLQSQPGNIFYNDEKPETTVVLTSNAKSSGKLNCRIYDVDGKTIKSLETPVQFQAAGEMQKINVPLDQPDVGWYGLDFTLSDEAGKSILFHQASFALLGKDTREAEYDSPYFGWWFAGAHYTVSDVNVIGPLYKKMGTRRLSFANPDLSEEILAPWKISAAHIGWMGRDIDLKEPEASKKKIMENIRGLVKKYPHCNYIHIFHESGPGGVAPEVYGDFTTRDGFVKQATFIAEIIRENFPQLKTIVGNSATSSELIAILLRNGFDPKYIDYMGIETPAQTGLPEKLDGVGDQSAWICLETSKRFGLNLKIASSGEYTCRNERNFGPLQVAQIVSRDTLISHAYEFPMIQSGNIEPAGNAYWQTLWGQGGYCMRNPLLYPQQRYVAMSTLTRVLDKVKLRRKVPTGVLSVYALEFDRNRKAKDIAYAIWTPRVQVELTMEFPPDAKVEIIEMFGKSRKGELKDGKLLLTVGPSPLYLISSVPVKTAEVTKQITEDITKTLRGPLIVANKMDNADEWEIYRDYGIENPKGSFPMQINGKFEMRTVKDEEKGNSIELELKPNNKLLNVINEYTAIRIKNPKPSPGKPHTVGLWVKGNSGWGLVIFEFMDAEGEIFKSYYGYHDWSAHLSINFDGWHFIGFPVTTYFEGLDSRSAIRNAGFLSRSGGNGKVDYPITLTGIYVSQSRNALDPTEMKPVKPQLRFRDLGTIE